MNLQTSNGWTVLQDLSTGMDIKETEEKKVSSKKNILSKEDFNKEVLKFQEKVKNYENERRKSLNLWLSKI